MSLNAQVPHDRVFLSYDTVMLIFNKDDLLSSHEQSFFFYIGNRVPLDF